MIGGLLKLLKDIVDPSHWAERIGNKTGLYDKAEKSSFRQWALNLKGWKWWFYQIVVCGIFFILIELLLNLIGLTMLPWR
tara:strand:- start:129 stop:368 length:240 start_codon:yes stop_codon:yes gene_type:complete